MTCVMMTAPKHCQELLLIIIIIITHAVASILPSSVPHLNVLESLYELAVKKTTKVHTQHRR